VSFQQYNSFELFMSVAVFLVVSFIAFALGTCDVSSNRLVPAAAGLDGSQPTSEKSPALAPFTRALEQYLKVRTRVTAEIPSLTVTDKPAEIESTSDRLAAAIVRGRGKVALGEFFGPPVDAEVRRRLTEVGKTIDLRAIVMPDDQEERSTGRVSLHARFPAGTLVSTMPPSVLAVLPAIPATLEYRFVGTTLILRDVEAALILDVLPNAVP
jgi:hypothetical protein